MFTSIGPQAGGTSASHGVEDDIAARAIAFARRYGTALSPAVYEVWYTYAGRSHAAINSALDMAMNMNQPIDAEALATLYHEHLGPRSTSDELDEIGNDLTRTIGHVTAAMDENMREHSLFSGRLRSARASLATGSSKLEVTEVVRQLHKANQQHLQAAQRLGMQLEKSRAQVAKLKSELIEVKRASNTDYLTGLPNRRMLDEHLDQAIFVARQKKHELTLLMGGIDGLDALARAHGVSVGDNIMQAFATQLKKELRGAQIAARFAGAKFAIMMPECGPPAGFALAEQVRRRFKALDWVAKETGAHIGVISVSFGGAALKEGDSREKLIEKADAMLVRAQGEGADRTIIF